MNRIRFRREPFGEYVLQMIDSIVGNNIMIATDRKLFDNKAMQTIQPQLETKRLVLRQFQFSDCHNIQALISDYEVAKTTYSIPHPYTLENARGWVMRQKKGWDSRSNISYGLLEKRSQELIGCTSLQNIFNDESQLGYWIGRSYWNRNYCTEATSALVQFAHARLGINKIYAEHQDDNPASGSVLKKLGFASVESVMKPDRTGNQTLVNVYCIDLKSNSL